jgi:hypothetical protein
MSEAKKNLIPSLVMLSSVALLEKDEFAIFNRELRNTSINTREIGQTKTEKNELSKTETGPGK